MGFNPLVVTGNSRLEARDALLNGGFAQLHQRFTTLRVGVIVAAYAFGIDGTAKQLIDRHAKHLATNIPKRLIDSGDRRSDHRSCAIEAVNIHRLPVMLYLQWVFADQKFTEILDARHHSRCLAFQRALSPTDDTFVGFDLYENIRSVGIGS